MSRHDFIERRRDVMGGKPVFKGTRITVEHVLEELLLGTSVYELLRAHPRLTREHVRAALLDSPAVRQGLSCPECGTTLAIHEGQMSFGRKCPRCGWNWVTTRPGAI